MRWSRAPGFFYSRPYCVYTDTHQFEFSLRATLALLEFAKEVHAVEDRARPGGDDGTGAEARDVLDMSFPLVS